MKKIIITFLLIILHHGVSISAPNISGVTGTVANGQSITISGTDFGTKSQAAPAKWDPVEGMYTGLSNGDTIPYGGANPWPECGGTIKCPVYKTTHQRAFGAYYSNNASSNDGTAPGGGSAVLGGLTFNGATNGVLYISYWEYIGTGGTVDNTQNKFQRITSNGGWSTGGAVGITPGQTWIYDLSNSVYRANGWANATGSRGSWKRRETVIDNRTSPLPTVTHRVGGSQIFSFKSGDYGWTSSSVTGSTAQVIGIYEIGWDTQGTGNATLDFGEIYVDTTLARVELCSGSTWAARGTCEIARPSAWGSTSITATVTNGYFQSEGTAYLYVVDSNGDANSLGHEVEIGSSGGSDTTPPTRSLLAPSGALAAGTTSTTLSLVTDEAATCRYSTSAGTAYASMTNSFSTELSASHTATVSGLTNGGSYTYYVRCIDGNGNANTTDSTISFSVASSAGTAGVLSWQYSTYSAERDDGRIPINIVRTGGSTGSVTVQWSSNGQTALHNVDYYGNDNVTVTFADGVTSMPINTYGSGEDGIEMIDNGATVDRYFQMILSNATGGATLGTTLATVTILGETVPRTPIGAGTTPKGTGTTPISVQ